MSSPTTMKLPELPPLQMASAPLNILTEILWRIDPAGIRGLKIREENIQDMIKIHLNSQAEIMRLDAQIMQIQATACENAAKLL